VEKLKYKLVDYTDINEKIIIKDKLGYYYTPYLSHLINHHNPRMVGNSNNYSIQNIKLWCELNNKPFELLSIEYIQSHHKLQWQCLREKCGEIFNMSWDSVNRNYNCPCCSHRLPSKNYNLLIINPKLCEEWNYNKNDKLPEEYLPVGSQIIWWKCKKCGWEWESRIADRNDGNGCPKCANQITRTTEEFKQEIYNLVQNEYVVIDEYIKSHTKILIKHNLCGYVYLVSPNNFLRGRRCPQCSKSYGETKIRKWLENNNIYFIHNKEFPNLLGLKNGLLSYDFYLSQFNLLIEYQGNFHDGSSGEYSKINLEQQQEHDKRKKEYANNNNIDLLEIWYWNFDNIEEILKNNIKKVKTNKYLAKENP